MSSFARPPPTHVFFSGGSWGCAFHIGVYRAMEEMWGLEKLFNIKFAGNSSGSLIAFFAANNMHWEEMEDAYKRVMNNARKNGVFGEMTNGYNIVLDIILKPLENQIVSRNDTKQTSQKDLYKKFNGRLFIGVTKFLFKYELISQWKSNQELRNTLHGSMHIPYYCTHLACDSNGERMIDGSCASLFYWFDDNGDEECTTLVSTVMTDKGDVYCQPLMTYAQCYAITSEEEYIKIRDRGFYAMKNWNGKFKFSKENKKRNMSKKKMIVCLIVWSMRMLEEIHICRIAIYVIVCWILCKIWFD